MDGQGLADDADADDADDLDDDEDDGEDADEDEDADDAAADSDDARKAVALPPPRKVKHRLGPKQRQHLKGLAHHLTPVVAFGQAGITDAVLAELESAIKAHELVKVRLGQDFPETSAELVEAVEGRLGAEKVQLLGRTVVFYRRHPSKARIELPVEKGGLDVRLMGGKAAEGRHLARNKPSPTQKRGRAGAAPGARTTASGRAAAALDPDAPKPRQPRGGARFHSDKGRVTRESTGRRADTLRDLEERRSAQQVSRPVKAEPLTWDERASARAERAAAASSTAPRAPRAAAPRSGAARSTTEDSGRASGARATYTSTRVAGGARSSAANPRSGATSTRSSSAASSAGAKTGSAPPRGASAPPKAGRAPLASSHRSSTGKKKP